AALLGRGQSGWIFDEIRNKRGLAYQVGVSNELETDYGYFAVFAGLDKSKIKDAAKIILEQCRRLERVTQKELAEAKTSIEGNYVLQMEDNFHRADNNAYWHTIKDAKLGHKFLSKIKKVTCADITRVAKQYMKNNNYTLVTIEQK
ncbi:MAG: insulinase family protein, partial [Phycisphaerales bacterium]|nr:insulinase family protein [Phycisphaerales bacterium]